MKFVIQAHFRGKTLGSVHFDYRFQHPKYKNFFFGFTQFVDKGNLEGVSADASDKERIEYAKEKLAEFDRYFKNPAERRQGVRKSMGPIEWFKVDGIITKHLTDTDYSQVMLKIAEGTYDIFEDRVYSIKITFDKVKTKYDVEDFWSSSTYIWRYLPFKQSFTPFTLLSWKLKHVHYSKNDFEFVKTLDDTFTIFETATEMNGHYLLKSSSGKWYTVDRHPLYEERFALLKGRYQIRDHLKKLDKAHLTIDLFKAPKEFYYIGLRGD